mmetsp:Transcript_119952/g.340042  ORF Transcript_119952/g.340042 Transcript_119952/m.340042 type:complete len:265 (-) Transcript_119952:64-858(-)
MLRPEERLFLKRIADAVLASRDFRAGPCHVMVYGLGAHELQDSRVGGGLLLPEERAKLLAISQRLAREFAGEGKSLSGHTLLSVRLLVAPAGCSAQQWHLDYRMHPGLDTWTIFAALTECTADNCTEVLMPRSPGIAESLERRVEQAISRRQCPPLDRYECEGECRVVVNRSEVEFVSLVMEPFDVVCVPTARLPHRRGPTEAASHTRVVLNCDFTRCSSEAVQRAGFVDDDSVTAASPGCKGVVPREVVDDLHQEVVVELADC